MEDKTPYTIPEEPGRWRAFTLAVLVHLLLLAFLWIGVRWQNETPVAVEAEIWNPQAQQAAPKPQPEPEPVQPPPPRVVEAPKPQPAAPVERHVERPVEKPLPNPDIALEQERKKRLKEEKEKERRLEEEREEREDREEQKKLAQKKQEQAEARKKELAKAEADKERRLEAEKERRLEAERERRLQAEAEKKREAEEERKRELAEAEKKRKLAEAEKKKRAQAAEEAKAAEQRRIEDLSRMTAQAAGSGGNGEAARSQGAARADAGYAAKVGGKIKSNTIFNVPDELANNPAVEYSVDLLPDGSVRSIRKLKGSGVPGFDEAVKRAIEKSQPFPPDKSGRAPSGFTVSHKPKDQ
jgi:colicin import membrane protein